MPAPRIVRTKSAGLAYLQSMKAFTDEEARTLIAHLDFQPTVLYPGNVMKPWKGIHTKCGTTVMPQLRSLRSGQGCCVKCKSIRERFVDLEARRLAHDKAPDFQPTTLYPGNSHTPWNGIHTQCGREASPSLHSLQRGQGCCKLCGIEAIAKKRRFTDAEARQLARKATPDFEPRELYPGSVNGPWRGIHTKCGQAVRPTLAHLQEGYGCCQGCAMSGFDPHSPGYWYLVQDTDDGTVKHGISNKLKRRLADHIRQGFTVRLATRFFENGGDALELEGQIKAELKALRKLCPVPWWELRPSPGPI